MRLVEEVFIQLDKESMWTGFNKMDNAGQIQFNEPPIEMHNTIINQTKPMMDNIPEGKIGGVFGVFTKDANGVMIGNAAIVLKKDDDLEIVGFIGKKWGGPVVYGTELKYYF